MARSIFKRFAKAEKGTVSLVLGLSLIPFLVGGGMAVDYMRSISVKSRLQNAVDAGALAAAASKKLGSAARIKLANDVFLQNWEDKFVAGMPPKSRFKLVDGGVKGTAEVDVPMSILKAVGYSNVKVSTESFVTIPIDKKAEVALVLDYSGSMKEKSGGKVKYVAMKDAAKDLVTDLAVSAKDRVKFGLVPFSHHVVTTLPKAMVLGQKGTGNWKGCTQDRPYPANMGESAPIKSDDDTKWGQPQWPEHADADCSGYGPRNLTILPLTDNDAKVTGQLDAMEPYAWTHIALGVEFGWHVLSPGAPYQEGAEYSDKTTEKFMVVLTDGAQTEGGFGPGGSRTVANGQKNLETLCKNAKASGITMMTISFGIDDEPTRDRLKTCASDASKYYEAESSSEIAEAFLLIKQQIASQAFLSK
jgi:Flp pilus assembly protein TadG